MQPESTKPVQDAVLLRGAGLGWAQRLCLGLNAGLGVGQSLGRWLGEGSRVVLPPGVAAHVWVKVMLGGRVRVHLGRWFSAHGHGTLGQDGGREGGQLGRELVRGERGRQGREARRRMLEDGAVGTDHGLNAGDPVNRPEKTKQTMDGGG